MTPKTHQPCPDCSSSDALQINTDGSTYCHSCQKLTTTKKAPPLIPPQVEFRSYRKIQKDVAEFYKVFTGISAEGVDISRHYPYPSALKVRILPKDFSHNKGFKNNSLFGMDLFDAGSSKKITIVEGEDDALAAYQMLGKSWPVVSLPSATAVKACLKNPEVMAFLSSYEKIIICTDSDAPGGSAAAEISRVFPTNCYRVSMSTCKDACEYLDQNKTNDFKYAWLNAKKYVPDNMFNTPEQFLEIIRNDQKSMCIPTGISGFDEKCGGLYQGYLTVFKAKEGIGKTELMRSFEYHLLSEYSDVPIAIMHMEETKRRSLLGLASYELGKNVTMQDKEFVDGEIKWLPSYNGTPEKEVEDAIIKLSEKENLWQFTIGVDEDPDSILSMIRYFSEVHGVKYVFFEPIQDLAYNRQDESTVEQWLSKLVTKMNNIAAELGVGIITVAHTNDDGEIRDCRMIGKRAGIVVELERDIESNSNETTLKIVKNRPSSNTGWAGSVTFDSDTFTIRET